MPKLQIIDLFPTFMDFWPIVQNELLATQPDAWED